MTRDEWERAAAEEDAAMLENIAWLEKLDAAAAEPGFSGQLRRAIRAARVLPTDLAAQVGVNVERLDGFRAGEGTLPSDVIDRLISVLGLTLSVVGEVGHD